MANGNSLELHAREILGFGEDWTVFHFECLPKNSRTTQVYRLTGAVEVIDPKGKSKWPEPRTEVYITPTDHDRWLAEWETRTGKCRACLGEKRCCIGWSVKDGTRWRDCARCKATGLAPEPAPSEEKKVYA